MLDWVIFWLFSNKLVFWLVIAIACLLLEIGSPGLFFFLSFFFGSLVAAISTFVFDSWLLQAAIFLIGTMVAFFALHYRVRRWLANVSPHSQTNVYAMRSKRGLVTRQISPDAMGRVKVDGELWLARSLRDQVIKEGELVIVVRVRGAHIIVDRVEKKKE